MPLVGAVEHAEGIDETERRKASSEAFRPMGAKAVGDISQGQRRQQVLNHGPNNKRLLLITSTKNANITNQKPVVGAKHQGKVLYLFASPSTGAP